MMRALHGAQAGLGAARTAFHSARTVDAAVKAEKGIRKYELLGARISGDIILHANR